MRSLRPAPLILRVSPRQALLKGWPGLACLYLCLCLMPLVGLLGAEPQGRGLQEPVSLASSPNASSPNASSPNAASPNASSPNASSPTEGSRPLDTPRKLVVLNLEGGIFGGTADYLIENIHKAEQADLPVLIIMDTPGGALDATRNIVKAMLGAKVPILVWVGPSGARAGSAGVFLTMASHVAAMAPGTNIGAAHPVGGGVGAPGDEDETASPDGSQKRKAKNDQEVMAQKIENDTLAFVEAIANTRGRNAEWARSSVKDSASVTAEKALELKVIDRIARDVPELLKALEGQRIETSDGPRILRLENAEQVPVPMTFRQRFLAVLSDPNLVYILMALGMLGLYLEFNHPGTLIPGALGAVFLLLGLTGLSVLPYNATGLLFLLIAGACFVAEIYITSFGLLTVGGAISLVLAGILLFDSPPELEGLPGLNVAVSPWVYGSIALASVLVVLPIAYVVARAQLRPRSSGKDAMVGLEGIALSPITASGGRVFVRGEYWDARSPVPIPEDSLVLVDKVEGLHLLVHAKVS